jgi:hypothetical protein
MERLAPLAFSLRRFQCRRRLVCAFGAPLKTG